MATPAVPPTTSVANMSGTYTLNKTLSDSTDALLKMQSVGWIVRQAAAYSNISITMKQYAEAGTGTVRLDVDQASTGGIRSSEERVLDWEWREKDDKIWGKVRGRSRLVKLADVTADAYLKEGWGAEATDSEVVEVEIESVSDTWVVQQIWSFADVEGQRRHVRRVWAKKGKNEHKIRLIYDWKA